MRGLLIAALCTVYSVQAWNENFGPLHIETGTGTVPQKYYPLTADDKHATRKAGAFVSFIKIVPQVNPLQLSSLGPYNVVLPDVNFQGDLILNNVLVQGLKSLSLSGLEVRMNPTRLDFNVSIPQVSADVNFELQAVLANQPLSVNGQLSAVLQNLALSAAIGTKIAQLGQNQVYQVDTADIEIDLGELQKIEMDLNKWKRFKRSGSYRRRVSKKYLEMKSGSDYQSILLLNKREFREVCDGSVQSKIDIDLEDWEDNSSDICYNQEDNENKSGSSDSEFNDDNNTDLEKIMNCGRI